MRRASNPERQSRVRARGGFTLLEVLVAISIMAVATVIAYMSISTVSTAWRRGTELSETLHYGDYVVDQLELALRSTYYPDSDADLSLFGFWLEDDGDDEQAADKISWVKLGGALVGGDENFSESPHRVEFTLDDDEEGDSAVAIRAWRTYGQEEDFDPEDIPSVFVSRRVQGFNCRVAYEMVDDEIDWLDEWEESNRVPTIVEITLYLPPLVDRDDPIELKRIVGIPVGARSWQK